MAVRHRLGGASLCLAADVAVPAVHRRERAPATGAIASPRENQRRGGRGTRNDSELGDVRHGPATQAHRAPVHLTTATSLSARMSNGRSAVPRSLLLYTSGCCVAAPRSHLPSLLRVQSSHLPAIAPPSRLRSPSSPLPAVSSASHLLVMSSASHRLVICQLYARHLRCCVSVRNHHARIPLGAVTSPAVINPVSTLSGHSHLVFP